MMGGMDSIPNGNVFNNISSKAPTAYQTLKGVVVAGAFKVEGTNYLLSSITVRMWMTPTIFSEDEAILSVLSDNNNVPDSVLGSFVLSTGFDDSGGGLVTLPVGPPIAPMTLIAGHQYWVSLQVPPNLAGGWNTGQSTGLMSRRPYGGTFDQGRSISPFFELSVGGNAIGNVAIELPIGPLTLSFPNNPGMTAPIRIHEDLDYKGPPLPASQRPINMVFDGVDHPPLAGVIDILTGTFQATDLSQDNGDTYSGVFVDNAGKGTVSSPKPNRPPVVRDWIARSNY